MDREICRLPSVGGPLSGAQFGAVRNSAPVAIPAHPRGTCPALRGTQPELADGELRRASLPCSALRDLTVVRQHDDGVIYSTENGSACV